MSFGSDASSIERSLNSPPTKPMYLGRSANVVISMTTWNPHEKIPEAPIPAMTRPLKRKKEENQSRRVALRFWRPLSVDVPRMRTLMLGATPQIKDPVERTK